ncbi:MAG: RES family NAD+ phosphorylase [Gammaproteobacteria bacterium]
MRVWRLCRAAHIDEAMTGEGARLHGGRWNPKGVPVVYASATLSLAVLEALVHTEPGSLPDDFLALPVDWPEDLAIPEVKSEGLPAAWREPRDHEALQAVGKAWTDTGENAVLAVPSAIVPHERNFLINPAHRDMAKIRPGGALPFRFDARLPGLQGIP